MTLRALARRLLGVRRVPTYYVPWITRPGLSCKLYPREGDWPNPPVYWHSDGQASLIPGRPDDHGFATIEGMTTDGMVALSDGNGYTATHGRGETVDEYPRRVRAVWAVAWRVLAWLGETIPAFTREHRALHDQQLLLLNPSNLVNLVRVEDGYGAALYRVPPMGSVIVPCPVFSSRTPIRLHGSARFNLYVMTEAADGAVALQHVK